MAVKFVQNFETLRYWHAMGLPQPCDQSRMAGDINWWGQDLKEPCNSASQTVVRMGMSADMVLPGRVVNGTVCKSESTNGSLRCNVDHNLKEQPCAQGHEPGCLLGCMGAAT